MNIKPPYIVGTSQRVMARPSHQYQEVEPTDMLPLRTPRGFSNNAVFQRILTACPAPEKNPFRIRAAIYEGKLVAAAHQAEVPRAIDVKKNSTGSRPK